MTDIYLECDRKFIDTLNSLKRDYGLLTEAEVFSKAVTLLKLVSHVRKTNGELIARKNGKETIIEVR